MIKTLLLTLFSLFSSQEKQVSECPNLPPILQLCPERTEPPVVVTSNDFYFECAWLKKEEDFIACILPASLFFYYTHPYQAIDPCQSSKSLLFYKDFYFENEQVTLWCKDTSTEDDFVACEKEIIQALVEQGVFGSFLGYTISYEFFYATQVILAIWFELQRRNQNNH